MKNNHKVNCQCASCKSKRGEYKGKNNPMFGKHHNEETRKIMSKHNSQYIDGRYLRKYHCIDCNKKISVFSGFYGQGRCKSCSKKGIKRPDISKRMKGRNSHRFGKTSHGKWGVYKGIWMRSSYEIKFTQFLDLSGIKWLYEPKTFNLGKMTYTPDFYIPEWKCYIEIKGWWRDDAKEKFKLFKKLYPKVNIKVLYKKELEKLGVL